MNSACSCCGSRDPLTPRKSKVTRGVTFRMCERCMRHEPRHWLVLNARTMGLLGVKKWVSNDLYCGKQIILKEVL